MPLYLKSLFHFAGKNFRPGKWTKICSLHFEPTDFYNFWAPAGVLLEKTLFHQSFLFTLRRSVQQEDNLIGLKPVRGQPVVKMNCV